ncbi:hypothetical protein [Wolbachia endosymbiont of Folsomia candida]|uniref:hypothetical protein n=1 Tax=Wolbachia endosymbiont of Folsomia candida TaxID=169402 RepID=UPI000AA02290|nr:hypothetical protein [Wolbachia endosymbiont of Folsomia candida]APR98857.1 hypothetical protein ASM33_06575 [Wolbachia endosymbiont of Folsomia candida]
MKELQEELIGIIALIPIINEKNELEIEKKKALEIIIKLEKHINDQIEHGNIKMTALGYVAKSYNPAIDEENKKALEELKTAIRKAGGKISTIRFSTKLPFYAVFPTAALSFCSALCFIGKSISGGDVRIAGYLSIFALLACIGLGIIIKKSGVVQEERLRRIEALYNTQREEESEKIVALYVNSSSLIAGCLLVPSMFTALLSSVSFAVVLSKDIAGGNTQAALYSFMFGSLIFILGITASFVVLLDAMENIIQPNIAQLGTQEEQDLLISQVFPQTVQNSQGVAR